MPDEIQDEWIGISEAARRIGVSQTTISKHVKKRRLQTKRLARDERIVLVNMREVEELYSDKPQDE